MRLKKHHNTRAYKDNLLCTMLFTWFLSEHNYSIHPLKNIAIIIKKKQVRKMFIF